MIRPFVDLLANIIHLYSLCIIAWAILSSLISFRIINAYQPLVRRIMITLNRLVEPALKPIRKYLPDLGGLDISPVVLLLLLNFLTEMLYSFFYHY